MGFKNATKVAYSALMGGLSSGVFELSPSVSMNNQNNKLNPNEVIEGIWEDAPKKAKNIVEKSQLESVEKTKENGIIEETADNDIKYTNRLKYYYDKSIFDGALLPLVDFDLYKSYDKMLNIELNGIKTVKDIEVKGHRFHFIDRVFGSVEQKRSGVEILEIKNTLLNKSVKIKEKENSIKIYGENCVVSINQHTGELVQVNPY